MPNIWLFLLRQGLGHMATGIETFSLFRFYLGGGPVPNRGSTGTHLKGGLMLCCDSTDTFKAGLCCAVVQLALTLKVGLCCTVAQLTLTLKAGLCCAVAQLVLTLRAGP